MDSRGPQTTSLLPQIRLFHHVLELPCREESGICYLAGNLEAQLGHSELLFEMRGDSQEPAIDLSCHLRGVEGMACHMPVLRRLDIPSSWLDLLDFMAHTRDGHPSRWHDWRGLWLEFDSSVTCAARPNLFFTFSSQQESNRETFCQLLDRIRDRIGIDPLIDRRLGNLTDDLAPSISVVQVGFLLPRAGGQRVKICLVGVKPDEFLLLQRKMGFPLAQELVTVWLKIMAKEPNSVCALDLLPNGTVIPAFEIQPASIRRVAGRGWSGILQHLPAPQGPLAGRDLAKFFIQSCLGSSEWPPALLRRWRDDPAVVDSQLITSLNHIKIFSTQHEELRVKYYFLQKPWFKIRPQGTDGHVGC